MTQLVELQRAVPRFREAGIKLYAVSYDEVEGLAAFARAHEISFPLLSDPDSAVIRRYGILNTIVQPGEALYYGVPYPGTYVVDEDGVVVEKFFSRHIANRESPESVIDGALGQILIGPEEPTIAGGDDDISITTVFHGGGGVLKGGARRRIVVRFRPREGLHLYGDPVPDGMVATRVEVRGPEGLVVEEPLLPPTTPLHIAGLDVDLAVFQGEFDIVVPIHANSHLVPMLHGQDRASVVIDVSVHYQACDDRSCLVPRTERMSLEIPLEEFVVPDIEPFRDSGQDLSGVSPRHMLRLVRRGALKRPLATLAWVVHLGVRRIRRTISRHRRRRARAPTER